MRIESGIFDMLRDLAAFVSTAGLVLKYLLGCGAGPSSIIHLTL